MSDITSACPTDLQRLSLNLSLLIERINVRSYIGIFCYIIDIIIMVIYLCYLSREHIALTYKNDVDMEL